MKRTILRRLHQLKFAVKSVLWNGDNRYIMSALETFLRLSTGSLRGLLYSSLSNGYHAIDRGISEHKRMNAVRNVLIDWRVRSKY